MFDDRYPRQHACSFQFRRRDGERIGNRAAIGDLARRDDRACANDDTDTTRRDPDGDCHARADRCSTRVANDPTFGAG